MAGLGFLCGLFGTAYTIGRVASDKAKSKAYDMEAQARFDFWDNIREKYTLSHPDDANLQCKVLTVCMSDDESTFLKSEYIQETMPYMNDIFGDTWLGRRRMAVNNYRSASKKKDVKDPTSYFDTSLYHEVLNIYLALHNKIDRSSTHIGYDMRCGVYNEKYFKTLEVLVNKFIPNIYLEQKINKMCWKIK